ncbi:PREDICTED: interferon lambda-3-like [Merops nubicus]|uniref:interferon lambda-3-like n=1 Tax=Merops nubicus TaxID=57421 RepID=UPI0004F07AEC|nr:PREDICTED: interferon lambda-3-like [Merops nubicus]
MLHLGVTSLLVLLLGASLGTAFPRKTPASLQTCSLSKYQFLAPQELKAMWKMKEHFEDITVLSDRECQSRLFHRSWKPAELSMPDRVMLVEAELDLVTAMLELPTAPTFARMRQRPLAILAQWRQKLQAAKKTETTGCLEASTILNLFQVLSDLQCAALREQCA